MSMYTEGTPSWLLKLENAQVSKGKDEYIQWLLKAAAKEGVPNDVIKAQLERNGYVPKPVGRPRKEVTLKKDT